VRTCPSRNRVEYTRTCCIVTCEIASDTDLEWGYVGYTSRRFNVQRSIIKHWIILEHQPECTTVYRVSKYRRIYSQQIGVCPISHLPTSMASSPIEKRTTMVSAGRLPSSKLLEMSSSRPFVHQACITTPSDPVAIHVRVC
jgi:hypothetical protein